MQNTQPRVAPQIPWRGLLTIVGLTLTLLLFLALRSTFDPLARQEAARQAERAATLDAQLTSVDLFAAALWRLALPALGLGLAGAAGYVALVIAYNRWADREIIKADKTIALTHAQQQPQLPALASLSYSYHDSSRPTIAPPTAEPEAPPQLASPIPSFAQLLDQGKIGPKTPLLLGYDAATGQAVEGSWKSLYTAGIGGLQGSGKTWAAVFLLTQSALQGGKLIVCDPHAGDEESLASRLAPLQSAMLCDVASDDRAILAALKLADSKLQGRKSGHIAGRWPIVVAIDEWLALRRGKLADELPPLVEGFSTEGRKLGCYALLLAQRWNVSVIGEFRNTLASSFVYRMRPAEARMMTGLQGESVPEDTLTLAPGECYLLDTRGDCRKIVIPQMTPLDVARVGDMLADLNRPAKLPIGYRLPATVPLVPSAQQPTAPLSDSNGTATGQQRDSNGQMLATASVSPEAARAAALFLAGRDIPAIVQELRGIDPAKGGRAYREAAKEISNLLRQGMREV